MAAKMFILVFAAVIWQARSQNSGSAISGTGDCSASETVTSASSFLPQTSTLFSGDSQSLNFGTSGFRGNVFPSPPATCTRPLNLCSESESTDFLRQASSTSRNGVGLKLPVLAEPSSRQFGNCGCQISPVNSVAEETLRSNLCATDSSSPTQTSLLRPNLPNFRPQTCSCEGSLGSIQSTAEISASSAFAESNSECNSCLGPINPVTPLLPNFNWNKVSPNLYGNQNNIANSVTEPCRPVSNLGGINNVQTTSTTETSTTVNNAGRPFGNQATSITTTTNAESSTSVNARPNGYSPSVFRGLNNNQQGSVSSVSNSEATATVSTPRTYSANVFGGNLASGQTSVSTAESSSSATTTSNAVSPRFPSFLNPGFNNVATSSSANSEASALSSINSAQNSAAVESSASAVTTSNSGPSRFSSIPSPVFNNVATSAAARSEANTLNFSGYGGSINSAHSNANAEAASSVNVRPLSNIASNYFGGLNNVGQIPIATGASTEAGSVNNIGQSNSFSSRFPGPISPFIQASANAEADSSINVRIPNIYSSNITPLSTSTFSETTSFANISPARICSPNSFLGFNNFAQPSATSIANSEASSSAQIESNGYGTSTSASSATATSETLSSTRPMNSFSSRPQSSFATSEATSSTNTGSGFAPNINGARFLRPSTVASTATSEVLNSVRPTNSILPCNCQPQYTSSVRTSEAACSGFTPNIYGTSSLSPSPVASRASSETFNSIRSTNSFLPCNCQPQCTTSLSTSEVFTPNTYGATSSSATSAASSEAISATGPTNFLPYQAPYATSLAASEASSSSNIGSGFATSLSPSSATSSTSSEAISSIRPPNVYSPCGFGGFNNLGSSVAASSADASSSINIGPNNAPWLNNIVAPSTVSSIANSEASSVATSGPSTTPLKPWVSNGWNNFASPVPATATASSESLSTANIIPTNAVPPNFYGGIPQTACFSAPPLTHPYIEPPMFSPTSCTPLGNSNKIYPQPFGYETFVPSYLSGFEFSQPSIVSSLNPIATSLNELSEFITSIVPIIEIVDSSSYNPFGYTSAAVPILGGFGSVNPLGKKYSLTETSSGSLGSEASSSALAVASTDNAAAVSSSVATSEVTSSVEPETISIPQTVETSVQTVSSSTASASDITSPVTPYENEEISSSSASSSTTSTTVVTEKVIPVDNNIEPVIEPVVSSVAASSAASYSEAAAKSSAASTATSTSVTSSSNSVSFTSPPTSPAVSTVTSTSVTSSTSSISSPTPSTSYQNPSTIELPPVTLEVQIPRSFASSLSTNFCGCGQRSLPSSCFPMSTSPVVYELQIPKSIPARLSCSLGSVPSTKPVLCMNVEPIGICGC